jgi:hypothetical protein
MVLEWFGYGLDSLEWLGVSWNGRFVMIPNCLKWFGIIKNVFSMVEI